MISLKSLLKLNEKVSSKNRDNGNGFGYNLDDTSSEKVKLNTDLLKCDLFCHITYLSALATSDLSRSQLFDYASQLNFTSSIYLRKVHFLAKS